MFKSLKVVLISMVAILMNSAKLVTLCLLKIKLFRNKGYDVISSVHEVTIKILSHDSIFVVDLIMCPKFCNSSISMRQVMIIAIL